MTRDSTKTEWKIQYRTAKDKPWKMRPGKFETRRNAREVAVELRSIYGFGNTKAVPYVRGAR